jgi:hypothetical protein
MREKSRPAKEPAEPAVKDIRRATRWAKPGMSLSIVFWVKGRKPHSEHMFSGLAPIADVVRRQII